jgi:hypothetical protein
MAFIEIDLQPSQSQMNWFGVIMFVVFAVFGAIAFLGFDARGVASVLWLIGIVVMIVYYAIPPFRRPLYLCWMYAIWPIGWLLSHSLLALIYYLLITPIGWLLRLSGRDSMRRKASDEASTYWIEHRTGGLPSRYFKQY